MNTLQELRDLLKPESTATIEDWMKYAKSHFEDLKAGAGADEYTPLIEEAIKNNISFKDLSYDGLHKLILVATAIIKQKEVTFDDDAYQLMTWSGVTLNLIQNELETRLKEFPNIDSYSEDYLKLLFSIKISNDAQRISKDFQPLYNGHCEKLLPIIQTQISQFSNNLQASQDLELLDMLQKEQEFLQNPDMNAEKKIERYGKMDEELNFLSGLLINYKNYVEQTITDKSKPEKEALITKLNEIIQESKFPLCVRMYHIKKLISQPENQATLMQDSWGAKLLAAVRDFFSFLFPREQTHSEFYKERLLALKQEAVKTQENAPLDEQTSQTTEQNKGSGMG